MTTWPCHRRFSHPRPIRGSARSCAMWRGHPGGRGGHGFRGRQPAARRGRQRRRRNRPAVVSLQRPGHRGPQRLDAGRASLPAARSRRSGWMPAAATTTLILVFTFLAPLNEPMNVDGGNGNDHLRGGWGNDTIRGGDGNDVIEAGVGDDIVLGGDGDDRFVWWAEGGSSPPPMATTASTASSAWTRWKCTARAVRKCSLSRPGGGMRAHADPGPPRPCR